MEQQSVSFPDSVTCHVNMHDYDVMLHFLLNMADPLASPFTKKSINIQKPSQIGQNKHETTYMYYTYPRDLTTRQGTRRFGSIVQLFNRIL